MGHSLPVLGWDEPALAHAFLVQKMLLINLWDLGFYEVAFGNCPSDSLQPPHLDPSKWLPSPSALTAAVGHDLRRRGVIWAVTDLVVVVTSEEKQNGSVV